MTNCFNERLFVLCAINALFLIKLLSAANNAKAAAGLQCYICDSTSFDSYEDAEQKCNADNLRQCPDSKHSACMTEGFRRDSSTYHIVKKCLNDCPVFVNSTAQHIRCCFKDACNDALTTATSRDPENSNSPPVESPEDEMPQDNDLDQDVKSATSTTSGPTSSSDNVATSRDRGQGRDSNRNQDGDKAADRPSRTSPSATQPSATGRNKHGQGPGRHRGHRVRSRSQRLTASVWTIGACCVSVLWSLQKMTQLTAVVSGLRCA